MNSMIFSIVFLYLQYPVKQFMCSWHFPAPSSPQGRFIRCPMCWDTMSRKDFPIWRSRELMKKSYSMVMQRRTAPTKLDITSHLLWVSLVCQQWNVLVKRAKSSWRKACSEFMLKLGALLAHNVKSYSPSTVAWAMSLASTLDSRPKFHLTEHCWSLSGWAMESGSCSTPVERKLGTARPEIWRHFFCWTSIWKKVYSYINKSCLSMVASDFWQFEPALF